MFVGFPTNFVADTKTLYGYNFVASLIYSNQKLSVGNELNAHTISVKIPEKHKLCFLKRNYNLKLNGIMG